MAEFEKLTFIRTTEYPYYPTKGDFSLPILNGQIPQQDNVPVTKTRLPRKKQRVVIGKTRYLWTGGKRNWELRAMAARKGVDEIVTSRGRMFGDGMEVLAYFVVWR